MGLLDIYSQDLADSFNRQLRDPGPPPAPASFSAWATLSAAGRAPVTAGLESAGSTADLLSGFGTSLASTGISGEGMFSTGTALEKKQAEEASKRLREGNAFDVSAGNILRRRADEFAPDPETAHKAEMVVHGLVRGVSKAVFDVATTGPVAGPVLFGLDEGNTTTQRLRAEGVDTATAAKVGGVTGVVSAVTAAVPAVGSTAAKTVGLGLATGPASFMAQEKLSRDILQKADYGDLAAQHDPTDPLGLAISTVLPLAIGGVHIRGLSKRAAAVKSGGVPLEQMTPSERVALRFNDPSLDAYAEQAAIKNGVPPSILLGIKNAGEKSNSTQTSPAGAKGVMQFMPETAKEMGVKDATDPAQSIDGAARYLRKLYDSYGSWDAAVAHYNGGGAQAAIVRGGGKPTIPETAAYLERVKKYAQEHASDKGGADPAVVDAARVKVTDDALMQSMPSHPEARIEVLQASDELAAGRMPVVDPLDIEANFAMKLRDHDAAVKEYAARPDSEGGKVLNTDVARELSPDYLKDRTQSAAVHEPASAFVKRLYAEKLADIKPGDEVMFTSGGTGAGKTSAISGIGAISAMKDAAKIVYDTNMNTLHSAVAKIEQALAAGADVNIVHVQRDPVDALIHGALPRATRQEAAFGTGRTVPLSEHARTHRGSAEVIQQLAERYKDNPHVAVRVIDNTRGKGGQQVADVGFVRNFDYTGIERRLHEALRQQRDAGAISEAIFRGTESNPVPKSRNPVRGIDGAEPARENGGQAASTPREVASIPATEKVDSQAATQHPPQVGDITAGAKSVRALQDALLADYARFKAESPYATFGVRVLGPEQANVKVGDALTRSSKWVDGTPLKTKLPGTAVFEMRGTNPQAAIEAALAYNRGIGPMRLALVYGDETAPHQMPEAFAALIKRPEVLAVYERPEAISHVTRVDELRKFLEKKIAPTPNEVNAPPARETGVPSLDAQRVAQIADAHPDMKVRLPGSDETLTVAAALQQAKEESAHEASEASLIKAAFECAMGFA